MEPTARQVFSAHLLIQQNRYEVQSFHGSEALNAAYRFKVVFRHEALLFPDAVLGLDAELVLEYPGFTRRSLHGLLYSFKCYPIQDHQSYKMECEIRPKLSLLNLSGQARVYVNQTLEDLIKTLLKQQDLPSCNWRLGSRKLYPYPQWVQAQDETDFSFFERVLAREGLNYLWDTSYSGEAVLSIVENAYDLPVKIHQPLFHVFRDGFSQQDIHQIYELRHKEQAFDYEVCYRDYDRCDPSKTIEKKAGEGRRKVSVWGFGAIDQDHLSMAADAHHQYLMMEKQRFEAQSQHPELAAGHRFECRDLPGFADGYYTVLSVEHHFEHQHYSNQISFIPDHVAIRPRIKKQQTGQLVHTAVIESSNDLPYLDQQGRYSYRTHIHNPDKASAVTQQATRLTPYGGKALEQAMGMHFPLKAQAEVLVMYLHNDLNQPLLQNSPNNALNHAPVTRDNSWSVLLKTAWGQYLEFCDKEQNESVQLVSAQGKSYLKLDDTVSKENITLAAESGSILLNAKEKVCLQSDASIHQKTAKHYRMNSQASGRILAKTIHLQGQSQQLRAAQQLDLNCDRHLESTAESIALTSLGDLKLQAQGDWLQIELDNGDLLCQAEQIELSSDEALSLHTTGASLQINAQGIALEAESVHFDAEQLSWLAPVQLSAAGASPLVKQAANDIGRPEPVPFHEQGLLKKISLPRWDKPFYSPGDTALIHLAVEGFNGDEDIELSFVQYHHDHPEKSLPDYPSLTDLSQAVDKERSAFQLGDERLYLHQGQAKDSPGQAELRLSIPLTHLNQEEADSDDPFYVKARVGDVSAKQYSNPMVILNQANLRIEQDKAFPYKEREAILLVSRALPEALRAHPQCPPEISYKYHSSPTRFEQLPLGARNTVSLREGHQYREIFNEEAPTPHYQQPFKVSAKANHHVFKRLMRPMIFNLRNAELNEDKSVVFKKEDPDARLLLRQEEIDYIQANGNNLMVFIHGYNVEHGHFSKHYARCEWRHSGLPINRFHTELSDADATLYRDGSYILEQFPTLKGQGSSEAYEKLFDIEKINGSGVHEWLVFLENHLNKASGFDGKDYSFFSRCLFISWPGNPLFGLDYMSAVHESIRMGPIVAEVFKNLKRQIPGLKLHVMTHSQGAGVMVHALNELGKAQGLDAIKVDHTFLCQAAIPDNAFASYGLDSITSPEYPVVKKQQKDNLWFCPFAHQGTERLSILYSKNDNILGPFLSAKDQPEGVDLTEIYKRKPVYEYLPAKLLQALGAGSIYSIANYLGCPVSELLEPKKLQKAWTLLIKRFPTFAVKGVAYPCSKTLLGQMKQMEKLGLLGLISNEGMNERLMHAINELIKMFKKTGVNIEEIKQHPFPPLLGAFSGLLLMNEVLAKDIQTFLSTFREYLAQLWTLIRSLYLLVGEKPRPAMGYEGISYKDDKPLMEMHKKRKLFIVDTTQWIWHHSDMKVGSSDIQKYMYEDRIIGAEDMTFGLKKRC